MEFRTEPVFESLKSLLGVVDNPERREQIEGYIDTARATVDRSIFDVLSQFAEGVNDRVAAHYEVALNYRPGVLDLDVRERAASEPVDESWSMAEGDVEKITLRIPTELKDLATEAAGKAGLSVNAWFVRMLARSLRNSSEATPEPDSGGRRRHRRRGGHGEHWFGGAPAAGKRLSGWVGPEE
jgi:predicted HicB family RNase H-like nuclease